MGLSYHIKLSIRLLSFQIFIINFESKRKLNNRGSWGFVLHFIKKKKKSNKKLSFCSYHRKWIERESRPWIQEWRKRFWDEDHSGIHMTPHWTSLWVYVDIPTSLRGSSSLEQGLYPIGARFNVTALANTKKNWEYKHKKTF